MLLSPNAWAWRQTIRCVQDEKADHMVKAGEEGADASPLSRRPGRPMSGPHVFGLQNSTADGVSTITSRLDERFRYRQDIESLERVPAGRIGVDDDVCCLRPHLDPKLDALLQVDFIGLILV